jgi:quinoprotein glucose dehydrogenase
MNPRPVVLLVAALLLPLSSSAQSGTAGGEWHAYGGDAWHQRYTAVDQIDASNVADLEIVWSWSARNFGPNPFANTETTPLMIDGVLYATVGQSRNVVAIDAGTGETLWMWRPKESERYELAPRPNSGRGVSFWEDEEGNGRIIVITPGYNMVALDPATGRPVQGFGHGGVVDLMEGHRTREGIDLVGTIGASSPAAVVGDVIVVGSAHHRGGAPVSRVNTPGDVRGYDAETGVLLWTFRTIPEPGELGVDTWENESWSYTGNAAVWAPMSWDPETGFVYLPTEAPTGDYYGGHRHGNNLFSSSIVCLDSRTGERVWHFQTIHHDIWDWDNPSAPILADVVIDGRERQIVALITKQAFVYVFDRITGEPIWPIEERPVPQTDIPSEWTSATQPFPTKPAPFDRQGFTVDDLIDFTPEIKARAMEIASQFKMGPIFTPPTVQNHPDGTEGTLSLPSSIGGANWEGGAFDPETGYLYVGSRTSPTVLGLVEGGDESDMDYIQDGGRAQIAPGISIVKPPWGRITAIDLTTGDHAWMIASGDTPPRVAEELGLDPESLPRTGQASRSMLLVTSTLLFAGEGLTGDPVFRAHDKATGQILAEIALPSTTTGLPMSYVHDGRQFVVVAVGGGGEPARIVALALPQ